jgi:hypothetical protein
MPAAPPAWPAAMFRATLPPQSSAAPRRMGAPRPPGSTEPPVPQRPGAAYGAGGWNGSCGGPHTRSADSRGSPGRTRSRPAGATGRTAWSSAPPGWRRSRGSTEQHRHTRSPPRYGNHPGARTRATYNSESDGQARGGSYWRSRGWKVEHSRTCESDEQADQHIRTARGKIDAR